MKNKITKIKKINYFRYSHGCYKIETTCFKCIAEMLNEAATYKKKQGSDFYRNPSNPDTSQGTSSVR